LRCPLRGSIRSTNRKSREEGGSSTAFVGGLYNNIVGGREVKKKKSIKESLESASRQQNEVTDIAIGLQTPEKRKPSPN